MQNACTRANLDRMAHIQVRNVPEDVHNRLKSQASAAGQSLNEYLLARMKEMTEKPTWEEMTARIESQREPGEKRPTLAEIVKIIREDRDSH